MPDKKEELENQIAHMIGYEDWGDKTAEDVVRDILSLIDAERCVWTYTDGGYETSCDSWLFQEQAIHPHCPDCGKRIEVKDE